jgi:hypothetical protein
MTQNKYSGLRWAGPSPSLHVFFRPFCQDRQKVLVVRVNFALGMKFLPTLA